MKPMAHIFITCKGSELEKGFELIEILDLYYLNCHTLQNPEAETQFILFAIPNEAFGKGVIRTEYFKSQHLDGTGFYELVEAFGKRPILELFAKEKLKRKGWDSRIVDESW